MDALELLKTRRSITAPFLGPPGPDAAQLADILTIASRVPDHGKLAPWRFIVIQGEARVAASEALAALFARQNPEADAKRIDEERVRLARAPLVIGVVSTRRAPSEDTRIRAASFGRQCRDADGDGGACARLRRPLGDRVGFL